MKHWILLLYLGFSVMLRAQNTASVQEAMANYDYKTVIRLIDEESASPQLLIQKAKALKGLGRTAEALSTLQHIIIELPKNQQALVEAAECCRQLSKFNEALGVLSEGDGTQSRTYLRTLAIHPLVIQLSAIRRCIA